MIKNPYYVSGPVPSDYFVGRSPEIKIAFDQISQRAHGAFYGGSGMGKSSFLRLLTEPATWEARGLDISQCYVISLNCTDINPFTSSNFFREILELLKDQIEGQTALLGEIETYLQEEIIEKRDLRRILRIIGQEDKFLLLLLDQFDWILSASAQYTESEMLTFLNEFRNLSVSSAESRYFSTIITSFRSISELGPTLMPSGSPWYNHYLCPALRPFSEKEIERHFFTIDSPLCIPLTPKVKAAVLQLTGGSPALLQNAFYLLYDMMQASQSLDTIDVRAFATSFIGRTERFFRDTWRLSTDQEQVLLMLIALQRQKGRLDSKSQYSLKDIDRIFSQRSRELQDLEEHGIILRVENETETNYLFTSALMEWWVIQEIQNGDQEELARREKVFFKWMSREQADQIKSVAKQVWEQKETIKGAIEWTVSLLGKAMKG
jgi:AAA ATPase domain